MIDNIQLCHRDEILIILSVTMTQNKQISIQLPLLNEQRLVRVMHTKTTVRQEGSKVKHELINNRHIFHNYGFGTSSVSMSYGCSFLSSKSFRIFLDPSINPNAAVIGSGVIGLMTAIELAKGGSLVTIYSDIIPELNQSDNSKLLPSQILPQIWMPKDYEWSEDQLKHEVIAKTAHDFFKISQNLNRYQSIKNVAVFDRQNSADDLKEVVSDYIFDTFKTASFRYPSGATEEGTEYETIYIHSRLFLEQLRIEAILRGIKFVQRKFNTLDDVCTLTESGIFNCSNAVAKSIFGDKNFKDQSYIVFEFEEPANHKHEYVIKGSKKNGQNFDIFCVGKKTFVVIASDKDILDKAEIREKLTNVNKFIGERNTSAKL